MIGPHESKFDFVSITREQETVVIVILIKQEDVDSILSRALDLLFHIPRIGLVGISP